jgi:integration host factor subunit beta
MLKSELTTRLIERVTERCPEMTEKAVSESVQSLLTQITEILSQGGRLEVRGFGSFDLNYHPARTARNPKTGKTVQMSARYRLRFKPAKNLRLRMNAGYR